MGMKRILTFLGILGAAFGVRAANPAFKDLAWTNANGVAKTRTNNMVIYAPGATDVGAQPVNDGTQIKFLWVPGKAAIRAGTVSPGLTNWDYLALGVNSAGFGRNVKPIGDESFCTGNNTIASEGTAFAGGDTAVATNINAFAYGGSVVAGGLNSVAFSQNSIATGRAAFVCGADGVASGDFSFVANDANSVSGDSSSAFGFTTNVRGENSFGAGDSSNVDGFANVGLGSNNRTTNNFAHAYGNGITNSTANSVKLGSNAAVVHIAGALVAVNNMSVAASGSLSGTNGVASYSTVATNQIPTTGWTNNLEINVTVNVTATSVAFTINNRAGTVLYTSPVLTATMPVNLQAGWSVRAASGLVGTVLPF